MSIAMRSVRDDMFFLSVSVLLIMLCVFVSDGEAQRPGIGRCPDYPPMKGFNPTKFQGEWYEIERSFYLLELAHSCIKFNFTQQNDNLLNVAVFSHNRLTGRSSTSYGHAKPNYLWPAILSYEVNNALPPMLARMLPGSGKYIILDTDYDHYAILYSCSDLGIFHADLLWILGRERDLNVDSRVQVYDHLINLKINTDRLTLSPQKKCPA